MPYADPETLVQNWLIANVFPGTGEDRVRVVTGEVDRKKFNVQHAQRLVRIIQLPTSPGDAQVTLDVADLEINAYAGERDRAKALASAVRVAMRYQLAKTTDAATGAFVKQILWPGAPVQVPSDTSMFYRFRGTARIWIHHDPLG